MSMIIRAWQPRSLSHPVFYLEQCKIFTNFCMHAEYKQTGDTISLRQGFCGQNCKQIRKQQTGKKLLCCLSQTGLRLQVCRFCILTAEILCVNIAWCEGDRKTIKKPRLVKSFSRCSWRTAETGFMLRSGRDHGDVNVFAWVFDVLECASERIETKGGQGYLFITEEKQTFTRCQLKCWTISMIW